MSKQTIVENTGNKLVVKTDLSKIFIWENRYVRANYTNDSYDEVTLLAGTLMGRVAATQQVIPCVSSASDGSQYPIGVLAQDTVVAEGDETEVSICTYGDVVEDMVILDDADTMDSLVSNRSLRDRIASDTVGIRLVPSVENTVDDNE